MAEREPKFKVLPPHNSRYSGLETFVRPHVRTGKDWREVLESSQTHEPLFSEELMRGDPSYLWPRRASRLGDKHS